jgi:hypothetical protein
MTQWVLPGLFVLSFGFVSGASAAPTGGCPAVADQAGALPTPLDLSGRPGGAQLLAGSVAPPLPGRDTGCGPAASEARSITPASDPSEALHGLPEPDLLPRLDTPMIR